MGKFPRPPRAVLRQGRDGTMQVGEPRVVYQSKIALVLRRLQNEGMDRSLQRLNMMMQAAPDLADHVDWEDPYASLDPLLSQLTAIQE